MKKTFLLTTLLLFVTMFVAAQKIERDWVDLALPSGTLWASQPEDDFFYYNEAVETFGVHMPTKWQWEELLHSVVIEKYDDGNLKLTGKNGNSIKLPLRGWIYKNGKPQNVGNCYCWTYTNYDNKNAWYVVVSMPSLADVVQWAYKNSYKSTILLVNK